MEAFSMTTKIFGFMITGVAMLWVAATLSGRMDSRARAETGGEDAIAQQQVAPGALNLTGQWTGTATIFGQPISLALNIDQAENAATGDCSISGLPAKPFAITLSRQQGNLSGTWSVDGKHPRPFSGSLNSPGELALTLKAGAGKHPNCTIDVSAMISDDGTEIAGTFKSSDGCKNKGQTGTFQIISQS
jgi:hypothetical protein